MADLKPKDFFSIGARQKIPTRARESLHFAYLLQTPCSDNIGQANTFIAVSKNGKRVVQGPAVMPKK